MHPFSRTEALLGPEALSRLQSSRVAVFGLGGVGGYAAEALARTGVGEMDLYDGDRVTLTNLNRQIIALHSTLDRPKADVMAARLLDVNPRLTVRPHTLFYLPETAEQVPFSSFDCVLDCIDTVTAKLDIITRCHQLGVRVFSAMGAGNRLDPSQLRLCDIYDTQNDPLSRVMRRELWRRGVPRLTVACSAEPARKPEHAEEDSRTPGSLIFVPAAMGLLLASAALQYLITREEREAPCEN